jgi:hypothetical protein
MVEEGAATENHLHDDVTNVALDSGVEDADDIRVTEFSGDLGLVEEQLAITGPAAFVLE